MKTRAALKPYWGKPAVRNFRGGYGNGAWPEALWHRHRESAGNGKSLAYTAALWFYSTNSHAQFERSNWKRAASSGTAPVIDQWTPARTRSPTGAWYRTNCTNHDDSRPNGDEGRREVSRRSRPRTARRTHQ